jgi:hypothetical protein
MTVRAHRFVAAGALAVAAVAAPVAIALTSSNTTESVAGCLAWFGNQEDGVCLSYSNGSPVTVGSTNYSGGTGSNSGLTTGPLLPGQTWNIPLG